MYAVNSRRVFTFTPLYLPLLSCVSFLHHQRESCPVKDGCEGEKKKSCVKNCEFKPQEKQHKFDSQQRVQLVSLKQKLKEKKETQMKRDKKYLNQNV